MAMRQHAHRLCSDDSSNHGSDLDLLKAAQESAAKEAVLVAKGLEDALARAQSEV